jgi:plastocyanin
MNKTLWLLTLLFFCRNADAATLSGRVSVAASGGKNADHAGVVIWLEPSTATPIPQSLSPAVTMFQKNQVFTPHVMAIQLGTAVDFPNADPIFHNVFSNFEGQIFDLQLYAPQTSRRVVFRRPGIVHIFCNIHETMSAKIAVLPTPYFAVSGRDGRFEIRGAPAGSYRLKVWHERSIAKKLLELERPMTFGEGNIDVGEIMVSEEGYVAEPHKNKYGQAYSPAPEQSFFYPGGRR